MSPYWNYNLSIYDRSSQGFFNTVPLIKIKVSVTTTRFQINKHVMSSRVVCRVPLIYDSENLKSVRFNRTQNKIFCGPQVNLNTHIQQSMMTLFTAIESSFFNHVHWELVICWKCAFLSRTVHERLNVFIFPTYNVQVDMPLVADESLNLYLLR